VRHPRDGGGARGGRGDSLLESRRSETCLDLALDLLVPPLSYGAINVAALVALAGLATLWDASLAFWLWLGGRTPAELPLVVLMATAAAARRRRVGDIQVPCGSLERRPVLKAARMYGT